jgi:hypothetical protein
VPDRAKHEEQARHNADLYRLLRRMQPQFSDWATTALFYSGVHVAEAFLYPAHSLNHSERFRALRRQKRHEAASLLRTLSVHSRAARYACPPLSPPGGSTSWSIRLWLSYPEPCEQRRFKAIDGASAAMVLRIAGSSSAHCCPVERSRRSLWRDIRSSAQRSAVRAARYT